MPGRWGRSDGKLHPSNLRYPLLVCNPCRQRHGTDAEEDDVLNACADDGTVLAARLRVCNTLILEARGGYWDSSVVQLVHPIFGDIGL